MTNPVWGGIGSLVSGTTGSVTPVAPAHVAGDWLFIVAEHANASNGITPTLGGGSAFTLRGAQTNVTTTSGLALWRAKATSSSMTIPAIGGNAGQDHISALVFVVSGLQNEVGDDPSASFVVNNLAGAASTSQTASTLGAVNATNALIIDIVSRSNDLATANFSNWTNSALANLTERFDAGTIDGNGGGFGINTGELAAPATLSATTVTSAANVRWASISSALRSTIAAAASITGVSKTGSAGTLTAKGAGTATITGVSKAGSVGTLSAKGGAIASLAGVSASGSAGAISAGASATALVTGVQATGSAGTLVAVNGAIASVSGVEATGSAGTVTADGGAVEPPIEPPVFDLQITGFGPLRPVGAHVRLRSVSAVARAGRLAPSGRGLCAIQGVSAMGQEGSMTAFGLSRVFERRTPFTKSAARVLRQWEARQSMRAGNGCE